MVTRNFLDEADFCSVVGIMRGGKLLAIDESVSLKQQLPGLVWQIFADPLLPALDVVEKLPGVLRASLASDHLRLIASPELQVEQMRSGLMAAGIQILDLQPGEPSMEDVFMAYQ